jgi:hypothetical protein
VERAAIEARIQELDAAIVEREAALAPTRARIAALWSEAEEMGRRKSKEPAKLQEVQAAEADARTAEEEVAGLKRRRTALVRFLEVSEEDKTTVASRQAEAFE